MGKKLYEECKDEPHRGVMHPCFEDMAGAFTRVSMLPLPEEEKKKYFRSLMQDRIKALDEKVANTEAYFGEFNPEDLLEQDPTAEKVLDLPHEICVAAANNDIKKVL